jgi:class 3 adenylate cyclase
MTTPPRGTGEDFDGTVFLSSVLGYTARSEKLAPAEIVRWTNAFLEQVTDAVLKAGGTPVKYMGDGFLAYFVSSAHERRALSAAVAAREAVADPLVTAVVSGRFYRALMGHHSYARQDIVGPTVNKSFRVHAWAQANAKTRIAAVLPSGHSLDREFQLTIPVTVEMKGVAAGVPVSEVIGRQT